MSRTDPRIDAYIERSAEFARPILEHLRASVHEACPQVEETIKWGMPTFVHAGGILCGMAAFKQHASFGFWKHAEVTGDGSPREGMGSFGRMTTLADVPAKRSLLAMIRKAMRLNEQAARGAAPRRIARPRAALPVPDDLHAALQANPAAARTFEGFSPSHRRDYIEWIIEAKRAQTRQRCLAQAIEWLAEGRTRHWKYERR